MVRFEAVEIPGTTEAPPRQVSRVRTSEFHMILNTNWHPISFAELREGDEQMRQMCREVFAQEDSAMQFLVSTDGQSVDDCVHDIKVAFAVQIGDKPKGKRLHVHVHYKVVHSGRLQLQFREAMNYCNEQLENMGSSLRFRYVFIKGWGDNVADYLRKHFGFEDFLKDL